MGNRNPHDMLRERDYLPILKMNDGTPVTRENWQERRAELVELLEKYSYGRYRRPAKDFSRKKSIGNSYL